MKAPALMLVAAFVAAGVAACSTAPDGATGSPLSTAPSASYSVPTDLPDVTYTDRQMTKLMARSIDTVWCGDPPNPDWCASLRRTNGEPDVTVVDAIATVRTRLPDTKAGRTDAAEMCGDVALATDDDQGRPIGLQEARIVRGSVVLAHCGVVPRE